jgi:hypothetical protein
VAEYFFVRDKAEVVLFVSALAPIEFTEDVVQKAILQLSKPGTLKFREQVIFLHSCITEAGEMNVELRKVVAEKLSSVLPPKTTEEAEGLGSAGRSIIEPLSKFATPLHKTHWAHCTTALISTMDEEAFPVLSTFAKLGDKTVDDILLNAKRFFESMSYNHIVLAHCSHIKRLVVRDSFDFDLMKALNGLTDIEIKDYAGQFDELTKKATVVHLTLEGLGSTNLNMLQAFPQLMKLEVIGSPRVEDFSGIGRCKYLRELTIESEFGVTDLDFLFGLNKLRKIDVSECLALTDVSAIDNLLKISDVTLPFASLYEQLNPRFHKNVNVIEILDQDAEDYL